MCNQDPCVLGIGLCQPWPPSHRKVDPHGTGVSDIANGTGLMSHVHLLLLAWHMTVPTLRGTDNDLIRTEAEAPGNPQRNR